MTPTAAPSYQLKAKAVAYCRPTLPQSQMSGLKTTKQELEYLIGNTKRYLSSPMCDKSEHLKLEEFLEGLHGQLDDINRRLAEGQV